MPDRLKIHHEAKHLQENIQHFTKNNPEDRYAFVKGIFRANKWRFSKFIAVRCLMAT